ncbi:TipC family immunity protein [Streptococcus gallolyticus]|uniref:TipC family immunity protein n=1 Tax=Streptococcus gallolyticus TaxID=315405 RepID=UPI0002DAC2BA|nr:TipC family immunity protein [Streptococcus gallolyticus]MCF0239627.1 TipC family immunity protein [Streptococcus gallolyticus]QKI01422.1 TipC family immunity protein [Streptococcus gallolyticus]QWX87493.1 TipC family immunity protein [Streptococcus gallolyticus subsp. gallolyticus TX20005]
MKKKVFLLISVIVVVIVALVGYRWSVQEKLKNPFDEMIYSETQSTKVTLFTPLSTVIESDEHYKADEVLSILSYDDSILDNGEQLDVFISPSTLTFTYKLELEKQVYLDIFYTYDTDKSILTQSAYLSDQTEEENEKTYHGDDLLTQLSAYGKDLNWLQSTSQTVLEDDILGLWFKKGSHRYSLDNLGDLTITYDDVLSGSN